jgi:hypothetical protein
MILTNIKIEQLLSLAGLLVILAHINLFLHVFYTRNTSNFTYTYIISFLSANILAFIYGLISKLYVLYIPAFIIIIVLSYILFVKASYAETDKVEKELVEKHIIHF